MMMMFSLTERRCFQSLPPTFLKEALAFRFISSSLCLLLGAIFYRSLDIAALISRGFTRGPNPSLQGTLRLSAARP